MASVVTALNMDGEDVGMIQRRGGARLLLEALESIRIERARGGQDLDGDVASQPRIARAVDLSHAASTNGGDDFVGAEARSARQRHHICQF